MVHQDGGVYGNATEKNDVSAMGLYASREPVYTARLVAS